jgi:hypothetical protein
MTPEENRPINTERQPKPRRTVRLTVPDGQTEQPAKRERRRMPAPRRATAKDRLLRVVELVVGDWAPTLREAALRVLLFTVVLVVLGIAFGGGVALLGGLVGFLMFLVGRRRAGVS